jgi:addiction module RelE/StbE family toxin
MQVRWTTPSAQDLHRITGRISNSNSTAALQVAKTLYDSCMSLNAMPYRGRIGRIAGTRELIFDPFIIVYRVKADAVEILRIYHTAQNWP